MPKGARNPKRRPIALTPLIDRGTRIEQQARCVDVPSRTRDKKSRIPVAILLVDASALLKKNAYCGDIFPIAC